VKISEVYQPKQRVERDRRTGEIIKPCAMGRDHKWVYANDMWLRCDREGCKEVKSAR
jgi:hypothetical protein